GWGGSRSGEAPQAPRQAAVAVDLGRGAGAVPAEPGGGDRRHRLEGVQSLSGIEEEKPGAAVEHVLQGERHLLVERFLDLGAEDTRGAGERHARGGGGRAASEKPAATRRREGRPPPRRPPPHAAGGG